MPAKKFIKIKTIPIAAAKRQYFKNALLRDTEQKIITTNKAKTSKEMLVSGSCSFDKKHT